MNEPIKWAVLFHLFLVVCTIFGSNGVTTCSEKKALTDGSLLIKLATTNNSQGNIKCPKYFEIGSFNFFECCLRKMPLKY